MKEITEMMIHDFKLNKLKYDFMGYVFERNKQLSFHHLRISKHDCKILNIPSEGYLYWNGAILRQNTSHDYLHIIQLYDKDIFNLLTNEMIKENEEMYGEYFDIPKPDDVVFLGWFSNEEVFRSGCTFTRGWGKIFYFQPGHEEYPIYYHPQIQRIITNAVKWAKPVNKRSEHYDNVEVK